MFNLSLTVHAYCTLYSCISYLFFLDTKRNENNNINQNNSVNTNIQQGELTNKNINTTEITQRVIQPPPTAVAPSMLSGGNADLCSTGSSGSVQTQVFVYKSIIIDLCTVQ